MERDVSFITGRRVQHALERLGHEVYPLDIEDQTTATLMQLAPDAAFVCLHGPGGEDGTVQALLETLGIPASRLSMISYGEEIPVCKDNSESCWEKNRRARFVVMPARPAS